MESKKKMWWLLVYVLHLYQTMLLSDPSLQQTRLCLIRGWHTSRHCWMHSPPKNVWLLTTNPATLWVRSHAISLFVYEWAVLNVAVSFLSSFYLLAKQKAYIPIISAPCHFGIFTQPSLIHLQHVLFSELICWLSLLFQVIETPLP